jgi:hypothetical protein
MIDVSRRISRRKSGQPAGIRLTMFLLIRANSSNYARANFLSDRWRTILHRTRVGQTAPGSRSRMLAVRLADP